MGFRVSCKRVLLFVAAARIGRLALAPPAPAFLPDDLIKMVSRVPSLIVPAFIRVTPFREE